MLIANVPIGCAIINIPHNNRHTGILTNYHIIKYGNKKQI